MTLSLFNSLNFLKATTKFCVLIDANIINIYRVFCKVIMLVYALFRINEKSLNYLFNYILYSL